MFSILTIWSSIAILLIVLEITGIFNFTAMLAGCSALTVVLLIEKNIIPVDAVVMQIIAFLIFSIIYILLGWLIFSFKNRRPHKQYHDIIGSHAVVINHSLSKTKTGKIRWSGTYLSAKCHTDCKMDELEEGCLVIIVEVNGNVASVVPEKEIANG